MASSSSQQRARDAWFMGAERAARPLTANEQHKAWLKARDLSQRERVMAASDWLLARCHGLATPGGLACGLAIHALIGLRAERPDLVGADLLAAVLEDRDRRLRATDAEDLIVKVAA